MPLLRQLLPGSPSRRRGSRGELRADMISAPLEDFRHTMHVGRGGAAFGDTAFLSGGTAAASTSPPTPPPASRRPSPHNLLLLLPWGRVRRSNSGQQQQQREGAGEADGQLGAIPPAGQSPIIKNALSLPALTGPRFTLANSGSRSATATPLRVTPPVSGTPAGQARGPPREEEEDGDEEEEGPGGLGSSSRRRAAFPHTDSVLSFHVDLGPSMLGDVLGVMDVVDEAQGGAGPAGVVGPARSSELEPPPQGAEDRADGDGDVDDGDVDDGDVDGVLDGAETCGAGERAGPRGGRSRLGGSHEGGQERADAAPGEAVNVGAVVGAGQDVRDGARQEKTLDGAEQGTRDGERLGAVGSEGQETSQGAVQESGPGTGQG